MSSNIVAGMKANGIQHLIKDYGVKYLSDQDLMLIAMGKYDDKKKATAKGIAADDCHISEMSIEQLTDHVGSKVANVLHAAFELSRRHNSKRICVRKPEDLLPKLDRIRDEQQEHFICTTLNGAKELIALRTVTIGLLNSSQVHPREVFADAITDRAASVILAHNHPSGTLEPSKADTMVTRQLCESGKLLGIEVLDHIIVTGDGFVSLKDKGYM